MDLKHTIRSLVVGVPHIFFGGEPSERAGTERLAAVRLGARDKQPILLESLAFADEGRIPIQYTADRGGFAPPLQWSEVPLGTRALVLFAEDPDAPTPRPFVHWLAVLPPEARSMGVYLGEEGESITKGLTSLRSTHWVGCAPPKGDSAHHYHFQLFALDRALRVGAHPGRSALLRQMEGHVIGFGELVGTYERPRSH